MTEIVYYLSIVIYEETFIHILFGLFLLVVISAIVFAYGDFRKQTTKFQLFSICIFFLSAFLILKDISALKSFGSSFSSSVSGSFEKEIKYTKEMINSDKLCPEVAFKCLSESANVEKQKQLQLTTFQLSNSDKLNILLSTLRKTFDAYELNKSENEKGQTLSYLLEKEVRELQYQLKKQPLYAHKSAYKIALIKAEKYLDKSRGEIFTDPVFITHKRELEALKQQYKNKDYQETIALLGFIFPDFWEGVSEADQLKWVITVDQELKKYEPDSSSVQIMAIICSMIGSDFAEKELHKPITNYLKGLTQNNHSYISLIPRYMSFIYLERDYDLWGNHLNTRSLSYPSKAFPKPKRHLPYLSHSSEEDEISHDKLSDDTYDEIGKFIRFYQKNK